MKTLVHYDHLLQTIIVQHLPDNEEPEIHLRIEEESKKPDPYWHVVEGKWAVSTPTCTSIEDIPDFKFESVNRYVDLELSSVKE